VTHLRKMMLEELQRRNYSEITTRKYLQYVTASDIARRQSLQLRASNSRASSYQRRDNLWPLSAHTVATNGGHRVIERCLPACA